MKSMSTTMTFKEPNAVFRGQSYGYRVPGLKNTASEMLPAHEALAPICDSLVGNGSQNVQAFEESEGDLKSNSLHEFAQLAGYLQTRIVPGVNPVGNGP
mmetsp:Transcript_7332/g.8790  ORF Transcript_7332/g.8790 Transcript_7332/m.8790 type:complete len:99 (+) Transcript_7332:228-524(+)